MTPPSTNHAVATPSAQEVDVDSDAFEVADFHRAVAAPAAARTRWAAALDNLTQRWSEVPKRSLVVLALVSGAYLAIASLTFGGRPEQFLICALMIAAWSWGQASRRFALALLPFFLLGVVYDLTHLTEPLVRHLTVHIRQPYAFDRRFFGVATATGTFTPNEFFAQHHSAPVDFVTGLAYILYVYVALGFSITLLLRSRSAAGKRLLSRFGWTFLAINCVGFVTYYLYPAAPPWYAAAHGFGPPDFSVTASPAAAARWDALVGVPYFAQFYGRSADVFGAIPSLHVTYPMTVWLYARELKRPWLSLSLLGFTFLIAFSAVYLQHHYVLDVLWGGVYASGGYGVDRLIQRWRRGSRSDA